MADPENTTGFKIGDRIITQVASVVWRKGTIIGKQWEQRDSAWFFDIKLDGGNAGVLSHQNRLKHLDAVDRLGDLA